MGARRQVRRRIAVVATFAVMTALVVADWNVHYQLWPTPTPFPAAYFDGYGVSVKFRPDGTVSAEGLPVWRGSDCSEHPEFVSGEGRWYQGRDGHFWIEVDGRLVRWGPDTQPVMSLNWEKVVIPYCEDYTVATSIVLHGG